MREKLYEKLKCEIKFQAACGVSFSNEIIVNFCYQFAYLKFNDIDILLLYSNVSLFKLCLVIMI